MLSVITADGEAGSIVQNQEWVTTLEERGLDVEFLENLGVCVSRHFGSDVITFPYLKDGEVVNHKYRTLDKKFSQDKDGKKVVWNRDCLLDETLKGQPIIITEGEFDACAALMAGFARVVSVPDGAPPKPIDIERDDHSQKYSYLRDFISLLDETDSCVIATDGDSNGQVLRDDLSIRIGKARCQFVTYPKNCKDLNDALIHYGERGVTETINRAKWFEVDGVYKFSDLPPIDNKPVFELGMGSFDYQFKIRRGDFSVVTGVPSSGKSTFLNHMMCKLAVAHGMRVCFASFEQMPQTDHLRALRKWFMWEFDKGSQYDYAREGLKKRCDEWIDAHFRVIHPNWDDTVDIDWLLERLQAAVLQEGCDVVVIDPFNEMEHNTQGESMTLYIGFFIKALKKFAVRYNVHVCVVAHPRKINSDGEGNVEIPTLYDIEQSAMWYNKCDLGLIIHRQDGLTLARTAKSRYEDVIGKRGNTRFIYEEDSAHFYEYQETD